MQLMRIGFQVISFPFVDLLFVEMNEFVTAIGNTVMPTNIVPARVFVVVVVKRFPPIGIP